MQTKRLTRRDKLQTTPAPEIGRKTKEKFQEQNQPPPLVAMTEKQKKYLTMLLDPNIQMIVCTGIFGCGKSFLSASVAADKFRKNEITKIIVARPYVQTGKSSGAKPGTALQKLYPYVRNVLDPIKQRLGRSTFEIALDDGERGSIEVQELESIRGRSFDEHSWLLIEEAQQSTPEEMLAIVTRVGDNCKLIISGDLNQRDIRGESGLKWILEFVKRHNLRNVGTIAFDSPHDIVRGGLVRQVAFGLVEDNVY
jgi:phosphate starvation-inducible PhoH-like protein